ncbi:pre-mRNA 3' end processing protein WDR33 isoform X3 [Pogoniulus pusillus]|uniref:pre-mRNA 3' end processing protein WDR33 isoform X3 n=1 Tax=Pogoniulus pusillus TaxID=488313 RepID=UPI0030B99778
MATEIGSPPRFFHMPRFQHQAPRQLFYKRPDFAQQQAMQQLTFDGKRMRKAVNRKTIDYNPSVIKYLENRVWQRDQRDMRAIQPDAGYYNDLVPPIGMLNNPMNAVTTKFVRTSTNKVKCPVFVVRWTPEGRRLVTGASSGEFTLWNGLTFNFETILQAHDSPVRAMTWSHNDMWMLTADHGGYVKYWQSNMNNVKMFQAHKEAIREASFSPTDNKFATCSDDGTVRIWDFLRCHEERILRGRKLLLPVWKNSSCLLKGFITCCVLLSCFTIFSFLHHRTLQGLFSLFSLRALALYVSVHSFTLRKMSILSKSGWKCWQLSLCCAQCLNLN